MNLRLILLSSLILCFIACKTNQESTEKKSLNKTLITNCPEDGACTFDVLDNKSLVIKTDSTGAKYPQVSKGKHRVLKFEYKRNQDPRIADDEYSEVVYAEIESDQENLELKDEELFKAKLLFGRLCFCRGQSGYIPVEKGLLKVTTNKDESVTYRFNFEVAEIPQVLTEISVTQK